MDTFTPTIAKKRRNAKGLQLSSRSLAPPLAAGHAEGEPVIQDALSEYMGMNQATPTVASSASRMEEEKALTPTQARRPLQLNTGIRRAPAAPNATDSTAELESSLASTSLSSAPKKPRPTKPKKQTSSSKSERDIRVVGEFGELRPEDFRAVGDLGAGAGGQVDKVVHLPTGKIMAKKLVIIDAKPAVRKQILRELQIMHGCSSPFIVSFYGAFMKEPHICICMEYMDRTSLEGISKKHGAIPIRILSRIAEAVLEGLTYLYDEHRIIHRDIKPSNILVNSEGAIKLCDFGVSGELIDSIANTFVGTSTYMSPERIQGGEYSVRSDTWSLGISLIELALGRFPFSNDDDPASPATPAATTSDLHSTARAKPANAAGPNMSILDLLQYIVNEPAPRLVPVDKFPREAHMFVDDCLRKDPGLRKNPKELLLYDWIRGSDVTPEEMRVWADSMA
ncbi:hypothetical protein NliqN6_2568 [Naganishia liquefaciens]|uniref:Protein kinase domain-containing protein n=1 Tax=Naganishia liquefaciens TaxID=104408 RepID=A0A8H3TSH5_9TREE|nr:hypothetical protein NliqN6_2568 [Naganishia liquefaciens]